MASTRAQRDPKPAALSPRRIRRACIALGLALALTACAPIYRNHGYVPAEEDLATLVVGQDTRVTAAPKVGRPSTSGLLNDTGWFYVQSRWEQRGALAPKEVDRQVVALTFSQAGVLQNVERFGIERGQIVPLSRRVTESSVKGQSVLAQLFASFGRLSAGQVLGE
ncbi:outer membrane protein assembly factor BamE [Pseudotabrizicola algicola]|uniref:Outer membrane protein assembly factor BamE n=1 Tax=Pseudotabrizicola algicola TaxID=2709381 RepID=A0A6B3RL81_9RHOB|nr:outer membrane protein assembly factor BamE [Pseudotabrizicola algicola]NEX45055.1 outer membrane protein assembly factor BamE [Pseudotabrizicola algicola]